MTADHAKAIADYFAAMFDQESANTVKVLRAIPNDRRGYKPDEKSRTAWELVTHLVGSDLWFLDSVCDAVFVYDPEVENKRTAGLDTIDDVVDFYGATRGPSIWFLGLANNHGVHHRGQLMTYLRPMGSKVPALYGGSADE